MVKRKVYMPGWYRWFITPLLLFIWVPMTYLRFLAPNNQDTPSMFSWIFATILFAAIGTVTWLMSSGKLPAYLIEED